MANIGSFALLCILIFSAFGVVAAMIGRRPESRHFLAIAQRAVYNCAALYIIVTASMLYLLWISDFNYAYVAGHTNRDLPIFYKLTSIWAGQEGSLVFWGLLLSLYGTAVVATNRKRFPELMPYVTTVFLSTIFFFATLHVFVSNPFNELMTVHADGSIVSFAPVDGQGLNPLLQHWAMIIHPPLLYLGYVGCIVPFAFALAALITRRLSSDWIQATRRWTLVAWLFLGVGIILGAKWAYVELGWGGYWGWDPVENASLMPWLAMTAFLHSVMIQERKGMLKVWNMVLVTLGFVLSIFGTFLTRSGIVSSVHAFAQSSIGTYFAVFLVVIISVSAYFIIIRLPDLKSENKLDSVISRESSFLFNNLILLGACFAVLWGTIFPIISEAVQGHKITVGAPFFNRINVPVGIFLLLLTGVGPLFAWRRTSLESLRRNLLVPVSCAVLVAAVLAILGYRDTYALMALSIGTLVAVTIVFEFYRGARARQRNTDENFPLAVFHLTMKNKRRYGGYIVHMAIVMLFTGFAGGAFNAESKANLQAGEEAHFKRYTIKCQKLDEIDTPNYLAEKASLQILRDGRDIGMMYPERRMYKASQQPTTEVAIHSTMKEDLYLVFAGRTDDEQRAIIQVYLNPLVRWVWLGGALFVLGTLIALMPDKLGTGRSRA
ncbi:MAG: heme lyase CcmF/NrfE family subunit [Acidobacteria bacterium]|nr:heme lyase CcmF/NrfE family subunit [Acidobacteriota bacterium]